MMNGHNKLKARIFFVKSEGHAVFLTGIYV